MAKFRTTVIRCGSETGTARSCLSRLVETLRTSPLDFRFAPFFMQSEVSADWRFFGNFDGTSFPFNIETNAPRVIGRLTAAISRNTQRADYGATLQLTNDDARLF